MAAHKKNGHTVTGEPAQRWHSCDLAQQMEGLLKLP